MFADVKEKMSSNRCRYRVTGASFDEVLFADDTICISEDTRTMNKMLAAIEEVGKRSGMKLNKGKCEALQFQGIARVKFQNKDLVKNVEQAKYLGCVLNKKRNNKICHDHT